MLGNAFLGSYLTCGCQAEDPYGCGVLVPSGQKTWKVARKVLSPGGPIHCTKYSAVRDKTSVLYVLCWQRVITLKVVFSEKPRRVFKMLKVFLCQPGGREFS